MKYLLALIASAAANTTIKNHSGFDIYVSYDKYDSYLTKVSKEVNLSFSEQKGFSIGGKSEKTYTLLHRPTGYNLIKAGSEGWHPSGKNDKIQLSVIVKSKSGDVAEMVI